MQRNLYVYKMPKNNKIKNQTLQYINTVYSKDTSLLKNVLNINNFRINVSKLSLDLVEDFDIPPLFPMFQHGIHSVQFFQMK